MKKILPIIAEAVFAFIILAAFVGGLSGFTCYMFYLSASCRIPELLQFFGVIPWVILTCAIGLNIKAASKH